MLYLAVVMTTAHQLRIVGLGLGLHVSLLKYVNAFNTIQSFSFILKSARNKAVQAM